MDTIQEENLEETPQETTFPTVTIDDLTPRLKEAMARAGWSSLTPVQAKAIPYVIAGQPVMAQARTGSGKTGAFVLPIMEIVNRHQDDVQALVLAPTRELAKQIVEEAKTLFGDSGLKVTAVYGGVGYKQQLRELRDGTHLVVGTPGRVLDHLLRKSMSLSKLKLLIFDEADRMLSMGFYPDMRRLQQYLPSNLYTCMFSATFPQTVQSLARQFMERPAFLSLSQDQVHVAETTHQVVEASAMDKDRVLIRLIEFENPDSAIIFCNTKQRTHYVAIVLQRFGYNADELSGDIDQRNRERVMQKLRDGELRFLVATDVAARGIDISDLSHVFQYEVPEDPEVYIHRAGRTGRAGATGMAITIADPFLDVVPLKKIEKQYKLEFEERPAPTEEELATLVGERLVNQLEKKLADRDSLKVERMARFAPMVKELVQDDHGIELIAMLLDDHYQQTLHTPPSKIGTALTESSDKKSGGGGNKGKSKRRRRGRGRRNS